MVEVRSQLRIPGVCFQLAPVSFENPRDALPGIGAGTCHTLTILVRGQQLSFHPLARPGSTS